jgi:hypothetical protein
MKTAGMGTVLAHAFGKRYELPVPLSLFVAGGAVVVVASFAVVLPRAVAPVDGTLLAYPPRRPRPLAVGLGAVVTAALVLCGLVGSQEVAENLLPVSFWLLAWIAVPLTCGVIGDWTRPLNPFAAIARAADRSSLRRRLLGGPEVVPWPRWLGWWPAVLTFFAAACGELVFNVTATVPHVIAVGLVAYGAICAAGGFLFGGDWVTYGELFSVLYGTWGRLGYRRFGAPGAPGFAGGLDAGFEPISSRIAFVLLLLVSVNFDGLLATPSWVNFEQQLPGHLYAAGWRLQAFRTGTFAALALATVVVFGSFAVWSARVGGVAGRRRKALAGLLPSLVPIAFGYLLVHNIEYLLDNAQLLFPLLGNPAGVAGWPRLPYPFNDSYEPNIHLLPSAAYWYLSIAVIIAVHVVALVLAHRHLARNGSDDRRARRSEYPWLVAMVGYTTFSLWLIAQPLAK